MLKGFLIYVLYVINKGRNVVLNFYKDGGRVLGRVNLDWLIE